MKRNLVTMKNKKFWTLAGFVCALVLCILLGSKALWVEAAGQYTVWFDGTDGVGTTNSLYKGATDVQGTTDSQGRIALPTTAGDNSKYKLNGWYDIQAKTYHKPGETVTVSQNTVFYAEWVQTNYDLGSSSSVVSDQPDVSSFVKTDVFDYNEIFNASHGAVLDGNPTFTSAGYDGYGRWHPASHSEKWKDSQDGVDFLFTNWYYNKFGHTFIGFPDNLKNNRNKYADDKLTSGIVSSRTDQIVKDLFDTSDAAGKKYLGQGDKLYQYDSTPGSVRYGYYYYDSEKNAADYNKSQNRFYVYNNTQDIVGDKGLDDGQRHKSFMPFEAGTSDIKKGSGQTNFWFGMQSTVNFFLPDNAGLGGNKAIGNKDMEFYFSGDDDVWVFVDDKLVMDLGGIHQARSGSINFSTGNVTVNGQVDTALSQNLKKIKAGDHKLYFYYLERGSSWSNASIYFNIAPRYSLNIEKSDADTPSTKLKDATFSVYTDQNCTVPAVLWKNEAESHQEGKSTNTFTTDSNGKINCYGMYANRTYYLKEVTSPSNYPSISDKVFVIELDAYGNASLKNDGGGLANLTQDTSTKNLNLNVKNKKPAETEVKAEKKWYNDDASEMTTGMPSSVKVKLYRATFPSGGTTPTPQPQPGTGEEAPKIPVNIKTQYFGVDAHGANQDTAPLLQGDLTKSVIVKKGGKLQIKLNAHPDSDYGAAIYSVTVNGRQISADSGSVTKYTSRDMQIGGRWGQHPPQNGTYTIDPVNETTNITITLIGYVNYKQPENVGSVAATLDLTTTVTDPTGSSSGGSSGGSGGSSGGGTATVIPSEKPNNAEPARYKDNSGGPNGTECPAFELTAANQWGKDWPGWQHLPTKDAAGNPYYYYVVEEPEVAGFSVSYSGNGVINGTVAISNVEKKRVNLSFTKTDRTNPAKMLKGAVFSLYSDQEANQIVTAYTDEAREHASTAFTSGADGLVKIYGLKAGTYYLKETRAPDGYFLINGVMRITINEDGIITGATGPGGPQGQVITLNPSNHTVTVADIPFYELPSAGGPGTYGLTIVGVALIAGALLILIDNHSKRKGDRL